MPCVGTGNHVGAPSGPRGPGGAKFYGSSLEPHDFSCGGEATYKEASANCAGAYTELRTSESSELIGERQPRATAMRLEGRQPLEP